MIPLAILGLGAGEIALLFLVILLVFGASKLPSIGSGLGKGLKNFKKAVRGDEEEEDDESSKKRNEEHKEIK
ncbi:MAG: twin-arginine translocase TatA/TatE family subunit [Deltaproteobacteria bacterium]|nr:twin-arginine translocase TatA/TatE family subunit [Deltaproteobacteria bacterium]